MTVTRSASPHTRLRAALFGVALGSFFPVVATGLECARQGATGLAAAVQVQTTTPLLWIIDATPLILLLCCYTVSDFAADTHRSPTAFHARRSLPAMLSVIVLLPTLLLVYVLQESVTAARAARDASLASALALRSVEMYSLARVSGESIWRPQLARMAMLRNDLAQSEPELVATTDRVWLTFTAALDRGALDWSTATRMRNAAEDLTEKIAQRHSQRAQKQSVVVVLGITVLGLGLPVGFGLLGRLRRAEDDARQQHDFIRQIMDTSAALIVVIQPDGVILQTNRAVERLGDLVPERLRGQRFWEVFAPPHRAAAVERRFRALPPDLYPLDVVSEWRTAGGDVRWVDWRITATLLPDGQIQHLVGTGIDITEQRRLDVALHESRSQIRDVTNRARCLAWTASVREVPAETHPDLPRFDAVRDTVLVWETRIVNFDDAPDWLPIGPVRGGSLADALLKARHPDDRDRIALRTQIALRTGESHLSQDYRLVLGDRRERWMREEVEIRAPRIDRDGHRQWELSGVTLDNTERQQAQRAADASQARLRHVLEHAQCILWEAQVTEQWRPPAAQRERPPLEWVINVLNQNAAPSWLPIALEPGTHFFDALRAALSPAEREATDACSWAALDRGQSGYNHVFKVHTRDGDERWLLETVQVRPDSDTAEPGRRRWQLVGVIADVTERKRAEELLKAATRELLRSNDSLQQFTSVASHDLKEPLRKIQMFGDMLVRKGADNLTPDQINYVSRMQSAAQRMQRLIEGLLAYSRATQATAGSEPVDLNPLVHEVAGDLEASIVARNGAVEIGPLPTVLGDPLQLRQLFQNLIGNGLKFHRPEVPPVVTIRWEGPGPRITVSDNGIGFDPQYVERIFGIFERLETRDTYEGTGIGLSICRRIVEQLGGTLSAQGRPGEGATFVIELPEDRLVGGAAERRAA